MKRSCLVVDEDKPSEYVFNSDGFIPVDLHGRRYLLRAVDGGDLEAIPSPRIVRNQQGPAIHLSVVLLSPPAPGDVYLSPHVAGGRITLTVDSTIDNVELMALSQLTGQRVHSRVAEKTAFTLRTEEDMLAVVENSHSRRVSMDSALSADQARMVMAVLSHGPVAEIPLRLECLYQWRELKQTRAHLQGEWAGLIEIARSISSTNNGLIVDSNLDAIAAMALHGGCLELRNDQGDLLNDSQSAGSMLRRLSSLFLERKADGFRLRERPPRIPLALSQTMGVAVNQHASTSLDLLPAIKAAMVASPPDKHLSITVLGTGDMQSSRIASRRVSKRTSRKPVASAVNLISGHDFVDAQIIAKPGDLQGLDLVYADKIRPILLKPRSLPVVEYKKRDTGRLLEDRLQSSWRWYLPHWQFVAPTANVSEGPFSFVFEQKGATSSGEPALFAEIHFELIAKEPDHLKSAISSAKRRKLTIKQIRPTVKSVFLDIPYVDESSGQTVSRRLRATFSQHNERIRCQVLVQHDTVKLAYGALSHPGFQSKPARIVVKCRFSAYETLQKYGSTIKHMAPRGLARASATESPVLHAIARPLKPINAVMLPVHLPTASYKPRPVPAKREYTLTQLTDEQDCELLVKCSEFSQVYRRREGDTSVGIGCLQPLLLGTAPTELVQELSALRKNEYRVFQQLHQPNRFLVVPSRYHLTRRFDENDTALPALGLYSVLDPANEDGTLFTFDAHLEPDIPAIDLQQLHIDLLSYSADPQLDMPTEVDLSELEITLLAGGHHSFISDGPLLTVSIRTALRDALLFKAQLEGPGISGSAVFTLGDGTRLEPSTLNLSLRDIGGPWPEGPVKSELQGRQLLLTNHTESDHEIISVELSEPRRLLNVNSVLLAGATLPLSLEDSHAGVAISTSHVTGNAHRLDEMRIFAEQIRKEVLFYADFNIGNSSTPVIDITAQLVGMGERHNRLLEGEQGAARIEFELPLTSILSNSVLEYTVIYRNAQGEERHTLSETVDLANTSLVTIRSLDTEPTS